jgi:hypothetical protein
MITIDHDTFDGVVVSVRSAPKLLESIAARITAVDDDPARKGLEERPEAVRAELFLLQTSGAKNEYLR